MLIKVARRALRGPALREPKRGLELEPTSIWIGAELGRGDVAKGVGLRLGISERSRELERAIAPRDRSVGSCTTIRRCETLA